MSMLKQVFRIAVCAALCASHVVARSFQQDPVQLISGPKSVTIIIEKQQVRFAALRAAQEVALEVFDQTGELIYSSGLVSGHELSWNLQNAGGEAVPSGFYAYSLSIKEANSETTSIRRGHLIVERGRHVNPVTDRVWVTSEAAVGEKASLSGGELTVSSDHVTSAAEKGISPRAPDRPVTNLTGFGTTGRIPKFGGGDFLLNSVIREAFGGKIGIGTDTPGSALSVAGQIESTSGGIKFPDGTVQLSSAATALFQAKTDATLKGDGTTAAPLGVAIPLLLSGSVSQLTNGVITVTNTAAVGTAILAFGGTGLPSDLGGSGLEARGGSGFGGGTAIGGRGGFSDSPLKGGDGGAFIGGFSTDGNGGDGVLAIGADVAGIGKSGGRGIFAIRGQGVSGATDGLAGRFEGDVAVSGNLSKGSGSFKIDHPLDPENKYLYHSFVESPDMKNIYDGTIVTDSKGNATVILPGYMEALNESFRYQLTVIGKFARAIVASEIKDNRFKIKTSAANVKVSWMVTGIRRDAYATKFRIPVEEEKPQREKGLYLHPKAFNQPDDKSVASRDREMISKLPKQ